MLELLHIENIAVIEQADITFRPGFNALTGETGAGKSIVIDAISAILGQRAYRDAIRTGADRAFISAVFHGVTAYPWFQENSVPIEGGEVLIQREIFADGRNVCGDGEVHETDRSNEAAGQRRQIRCSGAGNLVFHSNHLCYGSENGIRKRKKELLRSESIIAKALFFLVWVY